MIQRFFDKSVVVRRMRTLSGDKEAFQATATVDGAIQELDTESRRVLDMINERGWKAWFDVDCDIKEGDELTGPDGTEYIVKEVTKKDYGINEHLQVIMIEKQNE